MYENLWVFTYDFFLHSECPLTPNGSPKEPNYVHGYPKNPQLSPALRNNHIHYGTEASGKHFFVFFLNVITCNICVKTI